MHQPIAKGTSLSFNLEEMTPNSKRYAYQLQSYSPPAFHAAFKRGLAELNKCWNASVNATTNPFKCAKNFITAYGTHFVKRAIFGAKVTTTRVLDFGKANNQSQKTLDDCTRGLETWSALGVFTKGEKSSDCQNDLSTGSSISHSGLQKEHTESVGCKPSVDYGDDGPFPPEIIEKTLSPISDLFTYEFMTEDRVGTKIDFEGIGPTPSKNEFSSSRVSDILGGFSAKFLAENVKNVKCALPRCPAELTWPFYPNHGQSLALLWEQ